MRSSQLYVEHEMCCYKTLNMTPIFLHEWILIKGHKIVFTHYKIESKEKYHFCAMKRLLQYFPIFQRHF